MDAARETVQIVEFWSEDARCADCSTAQSRAPRCLPSYDPSHDSRDHDGAQSLCGGILPSRFGRIALPPPKFRHEWRRAESADQFILLDHLIDTNLHRRRQFDTKQLQTKQSDWFRSQPRHAFLMGILAALESSAVSDRVVRRLEPN